MNRRDIDTISKELQAFGELHPVVLDPTDPMLNDLNDEHEWYDTWPGKANDHEGPTQEEEYPEDLAA